MFRPCAAEEKVVFSLAEASLAGEGAGGGSLKALSALRVVRILRLASPQSLNV